MLATRVGSLVLHIPKFRDGTLRADLFSSYQRSEQALLLSLKERGLEEVDLVTSDDHGGTHEGYEEALLWSKLAALLDPFLQESAGQNSQEAPARPQGGTN